MELRDLVMMTADANDGGRIVNTGDLLDLQISEAAAEDRIWIDPATGYGFVFLPWSLTTDEDRNREAEFFNAGEAADVDS